MKPFFAGILAVLQEKWHTAGRKDPLFGLVDGFQIDPDNIIHDSPKKAMAIFKGKYVF